MGIWESHKKFLRHSIPTMKLAKYLAACLGTPNTCNFDHKLSYTIRLNVAFGIGLYHQPSRDSIRHVTKLP